jgi:hypothetical protein
MKAHNMKLKLAKQPVTRFECATRVPEPPGSLTWGYAVRQIMPKRNEEFRR